MNDLDKKLKEWFGVDTTQRIQTRRKRRTKKEMLEQHRVKCPKCDHSWLSIRG